MYYDTLIIGGRTTVGITPKVNQFPLVILLFQVLTDILIIFNVSIARQILVFIYLTFIPGLIILKLLKVKELDELETFFLSLGLSISFLMFTGLIVNEAYLLLNLSSPLSPAPMLVAFNIFSICGALIIIRRNNDRELINVKNFRQIIFSVFLSSLPILSIIGAMWVNIFRDNAFLLLLIVAIAAVFILGLISRRFQSLNLYTLSILMIGLSLLYHTSLISNYIIALGSDVPVEYSVFKITETNAKWSHIFLLPEHLGYGRLNSMLSVTILPTIYSKLLNAGPTWIYKILYPTLFSFVPLILFKLWQRNFGSKKAFVAIFLLMAQNTFYTEIAVLNRQMIGELFFALILFIIVKNGLKKFQKMLFFVIFSFALIVSHYAIAEILLFFLTLVLICLFLIKRSAGNITLTMVVLFSVMMFVWYIFTSNSTVFKSIVNYGNYVYSQLSDFLSLESRGETVLRGLGLEQPPTVWNLFSRMFAYTTEFFIAIGFIGLTTRRIKYNFSKEEYSLTLSAIFFLSALILVPGLANTMNMSRFYHLLLFFLAPIFVLGAEFIIKLTFKHQSEIKLSILVLTILIPYFLFQTGFIYEIVKNQSWSLPLSGYRMDPIFLKWATRYFAESEVIGAIWLSKYVARNNSMTYADAISTSSLLNGYGMMIYGLNMGRLSNATNFIHDSYIYLNSLNAVNNIVITDMYLLNTSDIKIFDFSSKVYSNGNCDIYQVAK